MDDRENVVKGLEQFKADLKPFCGNHADWEKFDAGLSMLKEQEPRVLQIKEMAFLEIAVFIETNGELEGKGTDLFLAIPYIYAVSQNMLYGYIAFVDGNTDVYDLEAIHYGKRWRCWTSRPTDEQRNAVKWE